MNRRTVLGATMAFGALGLTSVLSACSGTGSRGPGATPPSVSRSPRRTSDARGSRTLLVSFSRPGEQYWNGGRRTVEVGNTAVVARYITDSVPLDVFRIEPTDPYPRSYASTVERNTRELADDARPGISGEFPDLSAYDTILLGSPVWAGGAPMIMRTFLDATDGLPGKTIEPFVTFAVSGFGDVLDQYRERCPDATIGDGLSVRGEEARSARATTNRWLEGLDLP